MIEFGIYFSENDQRSKLQISLPRKKEVRTSHNKKQKISKNKNRIYNTIRG